MTLVPGVFSHSAAATFADARRDLEGTVVRDASGKMRPGLFFNHAGDLFSRRTDMRLNILDFRAVQDRGGACFFANQGTAVSPAFDAAPAANKRIDVLYVTQEIPALGDAGSVPVFGIVKGTASPTPVAPSLPANRADAIPLFDVEIPAGATSMQSAGVIVTPRYQFTAMAGGKVVVRNLVELAQWTPADSALAHCLADTGEYVRQDGAWVTTVRRGVLAGSTGSLTQIGTSGIYGASPVFRIPNQTLGPGETLIGGSARIGNGWGSLHPVSWAQSGPDIMYTFRFFQVGNISTQSIGIWWEIVRSV